MDAWSNEMLFYSGVTMVGASLLLGILYAVVYYIGKRRLDAKFDMEYGADPKNKK